MFEQQTEVLQLIFYLFRKFQLFYALNLEWWMWMCAVYRVRVNIEKIYQSRLNFSVSKMFYIDDRNETKKKNKNETKLCVARAYMCACCVWIFKHRRKSLD